MGIAVNDLTFMGGSQRDSGQQDQGGYENAGGSAYGATTGGYSDMDQEIPFAPEWRV